MSKIENSKNLIDIEKNFFNISTSKITVAIFKHWNLSDKLIATIEYVDEINDCPEKYKYEAQILHVVKIACNVIDPLSDESCDMAINKAQDFALDTKPLKRYKMIIG